MDKHLPPPPYYTPSLSMQQFDIDAFIDECFSIGKQQGFDFSLLLSELSPHQLTQIIKTHIKNTTVFGQKPAYIQLQDQLFSLFQEKFGKIENQLLSPQINLSYINSEKAYDEQFQNLYKDARCRFFDHGINCLLNKLKVDEASQKQIAQAFLSKKKGQLLKAIDRAKNSEKSYQITLSLNRQIKNIQQKYYYSKQRDLPILLTLKTIQFKNLRHLIIQWQTMEIQKYHFWLSAYDLFRVVHNNISLVKVVIKGVHIYLFEQFIQQLNSIYKKPSQALRKRSYYDWMNEFNPSSSLRLAIDVQLCFVLTRSEKDLSLQINALIQFIEIIPQLSHINVVIKLSYKPYYHSGQTLQKMWDCLRKIKNINIAICGQYGLAIGHFFRFLVGQLTLFTQIITLSFKDIDLSRMGQNDQLAIQQNVTDIFNNNSISRYSLQLSKISYSSSSQHSTGDLANVFVILQEFELNGSIRSLRIQNSIDQSKIDEILFNQLQTLILKKQNITLKGLSPQTPSKINFLLIQKSQLSSGLNLRVIFPKLIHLVCLKLTHYEFGHQLLCTIPSPHLEKLCISSNQTITDEGLLEVDRKWPYLKHLLLSYCRRIRGELWGKYEFKGLLVLCVDHDFDKERFEPLIKRGIKFI